ncbi:MAG: hypothetical protein KVP17_002657 [Porospora cf. gigantea B]|uniref:uncharacterized protein n=1 Tax=Porospora cf. gigantea B TaxID=2853592 RepID=UPI0035717E1B|nr:MAG: hypothetical protein KVP17_002657 [Porospora cf. gigantea B]
MTLHCLEISEGGFVREGIHWVQMWTFNVLTNFALVPSLVFCWKNGMEMDSVVAGMTIFVSCVYHHLQASGGSFLGGAEFTWHVADNAYATMCIGGTFLMLLQHPDPVTTTVVKTLLLTVACTANCVAPMNKYSMGAVIAVSAFGSIGYRALVVRQWPQIGEVVWLYRAVLAAVVGSCLFFYGLDKRRDPERISHGLWHLGVAVFHYSSTMALNPPAVLEERRLRRKAFSIIDTEKTTACSSDVEIV